MKENKKIIHILVFVCLLFLSLIIYLTYFQLFTEAKIVSNPYNRRHTAVEDNTLRGSILDRNGVVLAKSQKSGDKQERIYPFGSMYSQIIGYDSKVYGKSLLEAGFDNYLLNINVVNPVYNLKNKLTTKQKEGNDLYLSIDNNLQTLGEQLLGNRNGAAVVMNPKTGEILAMVSKPDFDPNSQNLSEHWQELVESQVHPFLPRATQGLYAPGSTFKVLISAAAIENGMESKTFEDNGSVVIDGKQISNQGGTAHGTIDLKNAFAVSSNVVFSQVGLELGEKHLRDIASRAGLGRDIPFDVPVSRSLFPYKSMNKTDMAAVGIGQGKLMVTPLQMAMIASAVANDGVMMRPTLVNRIVSPDGSEIKSIKPAELYHVMIAETAEKIKQMMQAVVDIGTGKNAAIPGVHVAGKTGTAENELTVKQGGKEHTWFIGFAPVEDPQVAIAVIVEYSGSTGGTTAAPIARKLMSAYLGK